MNAAKPRRELCDIPNLHGFRLIVIDKDGTRHETHVVKDSTGFHRLAVTSNGIYWQNLSHWEDAQ